MSTKKKNLEWFDTYIGKSVLIDGRLVAGKSVRIDGKIFGNIESSDSSDKPTIAVGDHAEIIGNIKSHKVIVAGNVVGNIYAENQVILNSTSTVKGDVSYKHLEVEQGAEVTGSMIMKDGIKAISQNPGDLFKETYTRSNSK